jgi:hypothetical protein
MRPRAVAAGVCALALAGCGGSSPTLARLQAQASRVCTRAVAAGAEIAAPAAPAHTSAFLRKGIATLRPELASLRTLRAPTAQGSTYAAALQSLARELTILSGTVHDLDRGADPLTTMKTLQRRLAPVESDDDAAWRTLGVPACVNR